MADVQRTDELQGDIVHVYDGIEEADNSLPVWWLLTFYGAILFAIGYWFYFHEFEFGVRRNAAYVSELNAIEAARGDISDEGLQALADEAEEVAAGQVTFGSQCVVCHDAQGQGKDGLGPNLTDKHWVHGGAPSDIYATISAGIGEKGMPAWEPILGPRGTRQVTAYVLTLRNTMVEGKEPEGDLWEPPAAEGTPTGLDAESPHTP